MEFFFFLRNLIINIIQDCGAYSCSKHTFQVVSPAFTVTFIYAIIPPFWPIDGDKLKTKTSIQPEHRTRNFLIATAWAATIELLKTMQRELEATYFTARVSRQTNHAKTNS